MKMKKMINQLSLVCLVLTCFALQGYSQSTAGYRQPASEKAIPKVVLNSFKSQYPDVLLQGWFVTHLTYWQNDYSSGWYSGWYGERTVVVYTFEKPSFFEVEFIDNPGERSRAIFNLHGYWYETRTQLTSLPEAIMDVIQSSQYSSWKISSLKEKIESPAWPDDIYRFQVSKGLKSRIIRMDEKGNVIQAKYVNE